MTENEREKVSCEVVYLAACALNDTLPDEKKTDGMDLEKLYHFCRFHTLTAIVCMALEKTAAFLTASPDIRKKWLDAKNKAIRKNLLLDAKREELFAWMETQGIWYMPLKGSLLKELYPKPGMRQMADNDILYDASCQRSVMDYMISHGYKAVSVGKSHHDVYEKPPVYNFELHTALFGAAHDPVWQAYYADVKKRLLKDEGNAFGYHFRDEDFYLYLLTHAYKHYDASGTGLRLLLDVYVYLRKKGNSFDWQYIFCEAEKLGIAAFECQCRKLSVKLFEEPAVDFEQKLSEQEKKLFVRLSGSGTYGTIANSVKKKLEKLQPDGHPIRLNTKIRYLIRRLIPDMAWFEAYVPFCSRHKWTIPFYLLYRLLRAVLFQRKRMSAEIREIQRG